jgi:hypothetical protein
LEEGDDLSLLEFNTIQYRQKGTAIADENQLTRIEEVPKRECAPWGQSAYAGENVVGNLCVQSS